MSRPLLQLALDHSSLEAAQRDVTQLKDSVDIVEAGTILCLNEGLGAVKALREQCPDKIIVADWKVADAGETLAQQAFGAGANWMTIICAAPLAAVGICTSLPTSYKAVRATRRCSSPWSPSPPLSAR